MMNLNEWLTYLYQSAGIRALDYQFARFMASKESSYGEAVAWLAARISFELGKGHICLPLFDAETEACRPMALCFAADAGQMAVLGPLLAAVDWPTVLNESQVIGQPGDNKPLIFDGQRLYLQRYWFYEHALAQELRQLSQEVAMTAPQCQRLRHWLDTLFARDKDFLLDQWAAVKALPVEQQQRHVMAWLDIQPNSSLDWSRILAVFRQALQPEDLVDLDALIPLSACLNWQKLAAAVALTRRFSVISGGPGTGKTTTVARLLAVLLATADPQARTPVIKLVAPTGKAAARLSESIGRAIASLPLTDSLRQAMPTHAGTIHRLLGVIPDSAEFRHHAHNPLHLDVLIVDEASMIDLALMYKLMSALPPGARLILLGDKDQLASVDAGAVLGDICSFSHNRFSHQQAELLATLTGFDGSSIMDTRSLPPMADCVCTLQKSYRFNALSGIGQLASAVNRGRLAEVDAVWQQAYDDIAFHELNSQSYNQMLVMLVQQYRGYLTLIHQSPHSAEMTAQQALACFNQCRLLCAVREGDFGVEGLNIRIERALTQRALIPPEHDNWYVGKPVMITRNDHALGIYNGDIGLCLRDADGRLKVYFELPDGSVRGFLPSRLPDSETAYAMTIHKSQGSEFDLTMMVLPMEFSPLLTRELVYTGITRARKKLHLLANSSVLRRAVKTKTERASGLVEQLIVAALTE